MKLLLATNSKNTTPNTYNTPVHFTARFNRVIKLPAHCQMCIVSYTIEDANQPKIHYVEITNLPVETMLANGEKGGEPKIIGAILSNSSADKRPMWVDLNNQSEMTLTELEIKIVNQDGELASGITLLAEIMFAYRKDPRAK